MKYSCDTHFIYLTNPPFQRKDEIKENLSGVWFDTQKRGKGWRFPRNLFVYRELWRKFIELRNDHKFIDHYKSSKDEIEFWMMIKEAATDEFGLRPYQNQDAII
jgi:hypothetical protein